MARFKPVYKSNPCLEIGRCLNFNNGQGYCDFCGKKIDT